MNDPVILQTAERSPTPALLLRPWSMDDTPALVEVFRDPTMRRWIPAATAVETEGDAQQWVRYEQDGWATGERFGFAVLEARPDSSHGQLLGGVLLKEAAAGKESAEVGYWTSAPARGKGVASRALETLTDWAFNTMGADGLKHLELLHQVDNVASCRVAEKTGFNFDRVLTAAPPAFPLEGHVHTRRLGA
ncbi:GNAT family N-acetyltransferase [Streptomyces sp. NPDC029674]|uniref:GNAT family N-acetyltransferase n=1 Tax=Streptomyces sp. NPDC029674 TaxID=3365297 RepID=UPI00384F9576